MTFDEIVSRPRRFRVNANTFVGAGKEADELIGKELELRTDWPYDKTVSIWSEDRDDHFTFNRSDVSELTPLSFGGRGIAIGDEVGYTDHWRKVYGFHWYDGEWRLDTVLNNNFQEGCVQTEDHEITAHRTPSDTPTRTVEQILASLPDADKAIVMRALKTTNNGVITGRSTRLCEHGWYEDGTCVNCKK